MGGGSDVHARRAAAIHSLFMPGSFPGSLLSLRAKFPTSNTARAVGIRLTGVPSARGSMRWMVLDRSFEGEEEDVVAGDLALQKMADRLMKDDRLPNPAGTEENDGAADLAILDEFDEGLQVAASGEIPVGRMDSAPRGPPRVVKAEAPVDVGLGDLEHEGRVGKWR